MLIMTIKTDNPQAKLSLFNDILLVGQEEWLADRKLADTIHTKMESLLTSHNKNWENINGIVFYQGPGSFTGLRIGLSVANALAYGLGIPIVATRGDAWIDKGITKLMDGINDEVALPFYGSPPHITPAKK